MPIPKYHYSSTLKASNNEWDIWNSYIKKYFLIDRNLLIDVVKYLPKDGKQKHKLCIQKLYWTIHVMSGQTE